MGDVHADLSVSEVREWRGQCLAFSSHLGRDGPGHVLIRVRILLLLRLLACRPDDDAERARYSRRADRLWLLGYTLLFLDPSLILFSIGLLAVGSAWLALWLVYVVFAIRYFPRVQTAQKS